MLETTSSKSQIFVSFCYVTLIFMTYIQKEKEMSLCFFTSIDICGYGTSAFSNDCRGSDANNCWKLPKVKTNDRIESKLSLPLVCQKEPLISYSYHVGTLNNQSYICTLFWVLMKILCEIMLGVMDVTVCVLCHCTTYDPHTKHSWINCVQYFLIS